MTVQGETDEFDWVSAQARCNSRTTFDRLRTRAAEDVRRRNGLIGRDDGWQFEFAEGDDGNEFEVLRRVGRDKVDASVLFERAGSRIHAHSEELDVDLTAVVTIDTSGACRLVVGEAMYTEWEFRRMALEQLFFQETEEEGE